MHYYVHSYVQPAIVCIHERDMSYLALTAMGPKPALHVIVITCSTVSIRPPQGRSVRSRLDGPMHLLGEKGHFKYNF